MAADRSMWGMAIAAGAAVVLLSAGAARGQADGVPEPTAEPAETLSGLVVQEPSTVSAITSVGGAAMEAWAKRISGSVERLSGRAFTSAAVIRVVSKDELAKVLSVSVKADLDREHPELEETVRYVRSMKTAYGVADRTIGMYNRASKTVYVVPENVKTLFATVAHDKVLCGKIVRLAAAHEMVHALQDQHVDLKPFLERATSAESSLALQCAIEGQAVVVADALAKELNWLDAAGQIEAVTTHTGKRAPEAAQPRIDPLAPEAATAKPLTESAYVYTRGRTLVRRRMQLGGVEAVWAMLASPPLSLAAVDDLLKDQATVQGEAGSASNGPESP